MEVFIGAENIISPLGKSIEENFKRVKNNQTSGRYYKEAGFQDGGAFIMRFAENNQISFIDLGSKMRSGGT